MGLPKTDANLPTTHTEQIICPVCRLVQDAEVEHTSPFWSYIHTCIGCWYTIIESEWEEVSDECT